MLEGRFLRKLHYNAVFGDEKNGNVRFLSSGKVGETFSICSATLYGWHFCFCAIRSQIIEARLRGAKSFICNTYATDRCKSFSCNT